MAFVNFTQHNKWVLSIHLEKNPRVQLISQGGWLNQSNSSELVDISPLELTQATITLLINIPLLLIVLFSSNLRKRKSHSLFMNVLLVHISMAIVIIASNFTTEGCELTFALINNGLLLEIFQSLILITSERIIAIKYAFQYARITGKYIFCLIGGSWLLSAIYVGIALPYSVTTYSSVIVNAVVISLSAVVLITSNVLVYRIAKKHDDFLKANVMMSKSAKKEDPKSLKASFVCFAVVSSFLILWLPYLFHNILYLSSVYDPKKDGKTFSKAVDHIAYLHGLVDPLLFIWMSASTKKEIVLLFNKLKKRKSNEGNSSTLETTM